MQRIIYLVPRSAREMPSSVLNLFPPSEALAIRLVPGRGVGVGKGVGGKGGLKYLGERV